ncbi:small ribosomal subunit protein mS35 [Tribolium castaneum]|uniref:28S ribosomal protein S35, mitochondrial-like Protein n=1 Tax=Tribolium castaneum TaxID=7070 RepID=D6WDJ0_TRICA|nr:PREDICTED: 28S ribosomal protein S35, mitochondrial [Tribolium castaneum]EFA00783.1 28S ribosomal protein S35, mitochondrial-like Protein [Tribolium castaneum]|eukprot:XP_967727.1 PREDICTED: 28S ribosomal protein S35, mitochondrial [Tribolium castaneum]
MLSFSRKIDKTAFRALEKHLILAYSTSSEPQREEEFRVLNLKHVKGQTVQRRSVRKAEIQPPRTTQMPVDQDWGNVWPGPRSFHPATVPLPIRQGYTPTGVAPGKYANAELMKIPNFLHLTPPVIKRQCEALKKFCTPWPKALDSDEKCERFFPLEVASSDYCHSSPTIRDPLARIVSVKFKLGVLGLEGRAKDKFLRLVGERYDEQTDIVTIVTDRCPLKKQNYDYAMYLITALYHESLNVEPWEELKSEADMEVYIWENNASKTSIEALFGKEAKEIENVEQYSQAVVRYMNEGENQYTVEQYGDAVRKILNLPPVPR